LVINATFLTPTDFSSAANSTADSTTTRRSRCLAGRFPRM
jgi:hypothetical protein